VRDGEAGHGYRRGCVSNGNSNADRCTNVDLYSNFPAHSRFKLHFILLPIPSPQPSYLPLPSVPENFPGCIWLLTPTSSGVPPQRAVSSPKRVSIVSAWPETETHRHASKQIFLRFFNTRVYRRSGCAKPALTFTGQSSSRWGMTRLLGMCERHHKGNRSECHRSAEYLSSCQC
jgi:hypothetical protein